MTVWRIRAWDDQDVQLRFLDDGLIALSVDELGDMSDSPDNVEIRRRLDAAYPDNGRQSIATRAGYWRMFLYDAQTGDRVLLPLRDRRYAIGEITGPYRYDPAEPDSHFRHTRSVRWLRTGPRDELPDQVKKVVNAPGTICRVNDPNGLS